MINMSSVAIVCVLFIASQQASLVLGEACWTQWYDRDSPGGSGDWETLADLRTEHPGKICPSPTAIEFETLNGLSAAATGDVISAQDTTKGFVCKNADQADGKKCSDYRVRFSCPESYCDTDVCWTKWYDRDGPSGDGDWETLSALQAEHPDAICSNPVALEAQTLAGLSVAEAGDVIHKRDPIKGFVCRNKDQPEGKTCSDYRVRFSCPSEFCATHVCWTDWLNRDDPSGSGTGDWECLADYYKERPGVICQYPLGIEAQTQGGKTAAEAGDVIHKMDTTTGFVCLNAEQDGGICYDYEVRFSCPSSFCEKP
ncbi:Cartilage intermediate layer protein 2 [Liparis tanakae]|uniref:Cartilage intermediate layer protein 2 n=1 Tax=Liparis tanakae TaxID=230148 RepID=A0A4Z2FUR1_9TELE|nr:Cartilage intermediate layer protein 2 [Liparis tanakae]